jgi:hypothetical protein
MPEINLMAELDAMDCWCGKDPDECEENGGCRWTRALGDLRLEAAEARSEAAMIRDHARRYFKAVYGPDYLYRAPETFGNLVERWIWAVASEVPEMARTSIADIERHCAERDGADSSDEEGR